MSDLKKLAVFVSGTGSNFRAIQAAIEGGSITGQIDLVVSNTAGCKAAEYAREKGITVYVYPESNRKPVELLNLLRERSIDIIILAGYLKLVPAEVVRAYPRAMLNIHPGPLPRFGGKGFYGKKVHEAVLNSGVAFSGPTVHFVDEIYDHGPVVAHDPVPVQPEDTVETLAARVLEKEHILYPQVVAALCKDRIRWNSQGKPEIFE